MNNTKIKEYKMNQYSFINGDFTNGSPILFSKKVKKNTKFPITHSSDKSTKNTISILSTDNCYNGNNHNCDHATLNDDVENIGTKLNVAFEALEKLLINNNHNKEEITNNDSFSISHQDDKTDSKSNKKNTIAISIPKLDFSDIFDYYENTPVYIKKIKSRKNKIKNNRVNFKFSDKIILKHHHHRHHSHSVIKE